MKYSIQDTVEFDQRLEMTLDDVSDILNDCGLSRSLVIMDTDRFAKLNTKKLDVIHLDDVERVKDCIKVTVHKGSVNVVNVKDLYAYCCMYRFDGLILVDRALGMGISEELFTNMRKVGFDIFLIDIVD